MPLLCARTHPEDIVVQVGTAANAHIQDRGIQRQLRKQQRFCCLHLLSRAIWRLLPLRKQSAAPSCFFWGAVMPVHLVGWLCCSVAGCTGQSETGLHAQDCPPGSLGIADARSVYTTHDHNSTNMGPVVVLAVAVNSIVDTRKLG